MTDQRPPELFAERPIRSDFARRRMVVPYAVRRIITVTVLAAAIGGGLYWKFGTSSQQVASGEIPTIKSDGVYKQRPEEPGGLDIPHQDVQVYQELDNKTPPKPEVEHLLPGPEAPTAPPPQAAARPPTPQELESLTPEPKKTATTALQPEVVPAPAAVPVAPVTPPTPVPVAEAPPAPASAPKTETKMAAKVAANATPKTIDDVIKNVNAQPKASSGSSAIQLASVQSQSVAQSMKSQLQSKYGDILGSAQLRVVKADLGSKGIYYRIQSQPISENEAKSMCAAIKKIKAGCILVHP